MSNKANCFCGSDLRFEDCCEPYFLDKLKAPTALALMKSRYCAYATQQVDYLLKTTHSSQLKNNSREDILNWSKSNTWSKLEILSFSATTVEFKAYFVDEKGVLKVHYEFSNFVCENGSWFYFDGIFE